MMRKVKLVVASAMILAAGCVTARSQLVVAPSEDAYAAALGRLTEQERMALNGGLKISLGQTHASYVPPVNPMTGKSLANLFTVDYPAFVQFINGRLATKATRSVEIRSMRSLELEAMDTGKMAYRFTVEIEASTGASDRIQAKGNGTGPAFSVWRVANADTNPLSVRSANVAFFVGLLRAVIEVQHQAVKVSK